MRVLIDRIAREELRGKRTSHRVSAIVETDQILVLDRGRLVERSAYGELLALTSPGSG